jgi:predicted Fe-S protein YdhL (DUF1289 family)
MSSNLAVDVGASPCIRNCCLDEKKVCMGCGRSLPEILEWHHADTSRQQQISSYAQKRLLERPTISSW